MDGLIAAAVPALLIAGTLAGWWLRARLHERHRTAETVDALRAVTSMMVTFSALVLGMLTSSAKSDFDGQVRNLQTFSIRLIELNQRLREYGPPADEIRAALRRYTAAAIADSWPNEPPPPGDYPSVIDGSRKSRRLESRALGRMLLAVDEHIGALTAATPLQRQLTPVLEADMSAALQGRWQLVAAAATGVSWPFLGVLMLWLTLAFFTLGLSTPPSRLHAAVIGAVAVSVCAAVYLIVDFDTPLSGLLNLSSAPMHDALDHMDEALVTAPDR